MAENAGGFFYRLNIESNVDNVNKSMSQFLSTSKKTAGAIVGITASAKLLSNTYRDLNASAIVTGESSIYLKQIGNEFRLIGFSAKEGIGLVENLSDKIKNFRNLGEGEVEALARLNVDISPTDTSESLIRKLRASASQNLDLFTTIAPQLGITKGQQVFLSQQGSEFEKNREQARATIGDVNETIRLQKDFNKSLGGFINTLDGATQELFKLTPELNKFLDFLSEDVNKFGIKRLTEEEYSKKTSDIVESLSSVDGFKSLISDLFTISVVNPNQQGQTGLSPIVNNRNTVNINVSSIQEANELQVYNEARGL